MKKFLPALVLIGLLAVPAVSLAQVGAEIPEDYEGPTEIITSGRDLLNLIDTIGNWVFVILLAIAAIFLTVAGYLFVTAGGNPEQVNKARQMLVNALIGIAIAVGAKGLVALISDILKG